jgi:hypothetical protein
MYANKNKPTKKKSIKKVKRWFVAASGWGIDLEMGSGDAKTLKKRSAVPLAPNSHLINLNGTVSGTAFKHNGIYTANPLYGISQGTTDSSRIGDTIHIDHISLRWLVETLNGTTPSNPAIVRFMVVALTQQYANSNFTSGVGSTDMFYAINQGAVVNARVDSRLCKVLCDETVSINSMVASTESMAIGEMHCTIDAPFEFRTGTQYGSAMNLYILAIPYTAGGTSGTTLVGNFSYDYTVAFRDV